MDVSEKIGEWYRIGKINPDSEMLEKRLEGLSDLLENTKLNDKLNYIRLFIFSKDSIEDVTSNFSSSFLKFDPAFKVNDNQIELSILSGAFLISCLDNSEDSDSNLIALSVVCSDFIGLSSRIPVPEQKFEFIEYLKKKAIVKRNKQLSIGPLKFNIEEQKAQLVDSYKHNAVNNLKDPLTNYLNSIEEGLEYLSEYYYKNLNNLYSTLMFQREETNILWWLFGEYCNELKTNVSELNQKEACLVIGKELAGLTNELPPPIAIEAFIKKMLSFCSGGKKQNISIEDAVTNSDIDWRKKNYKNTLIGKIDLLPLTYAIVRSVESSDQKSWLSSFKDSTRIDPKEKLPAPSLSLQLYNETILFNELQRVKQNGR